MRYKCDNCKFQQSQMADFDYPYDVIYCSKGHWDGAGENEPDGYNSCWDKCKDFEEKE